MPCEFAPDRYVYSQVYRGGCVLLRAIRWSTQLFGYKSRPPDPELVGERWRAMWLERLESNTPQIISSLQHQNYGEYWKSRAIDFERIRCPFYAVGGWADGSYVGAVDEALRKLNVPRKGLIGPWGHRFPHLAAPGPAIGFLQETLRWFDRWMRGKDNGRRERSGAHGLDAAGGAGEELLRGIARPLGGGAAMAVAAHQAAALCR